MKLTKLYSDISINYDPITRRFPGREFRIVAFEVLKVNQRTEGSSSDLPSVRISILSATTVAETLLYVFENPAVPESSSEPEDISPPAEIPGLN